MGCPVDKDLMKLVRDEVVTLKQDLEAIEKHSIDEAKKISDALQNIKEELDKRITELECQVGELKQRQDVSEERNAVLEKKQSDLEQTMASVKEDVEVLQSKSDDSESRVEKLESLLEGRLNVSSDTVAFLAPSRNSCFCGRVNELNAIAAHLDEDSNSCSRTAICGLGGVGKTSLALEFSWRYKNKYPGGIFWISGENSRVFQSSVREMALEMQITTPENDFSSTMSKALSWLKRQNRLWCLVVDNLDDLAMSEDLRKLLRGKWMQGARGHIIITTRKEPREIRKETDIEERFCIKLTCFTQETSIEFLRKKTDKKEGEDSEIRELATELDGLPLALDQAAAYIRYLSCSVKDYVQEYREQKVELLKEMKAQDPHGEYTSRDRLAVHTTWLMNFEHITKSNRYNKELRVAATLIMEMSAHLGPDDIPYEVINKGLPQIQSPSFVGVVNSPLGRKKVMSLLTELSLFQQFGANSYCVHRLVQEVIRSWMDEKRKEVVFNQEFFTKEFAFISTVRSLHHALVETRSPVDICETFKEDSVFSVENPPSLRLWGKLASHATYLQEHLQDFTAKNEESASALLYTEETVLLLNEVAISFSVAHEKVKAQEIQKRKLDYLTHLEKPPSEETLKLLLYFNMPLQDRHYKLISHCMRELPSNREDSTETERTDNANKLREQGNEAVTEREYQKALDLYTKAIELSTNDYRLYSNRALCYLKLDKPQAQKALDDCVKCLSIKPFYSKALLRKAWALHEQLKRPGSDQKLLKSCAMATAALAIYFATNTHDKEFIKEKFPDVYYDVLTSGSQLEFALRVPQTANRTFLLPEGEYNVSVLGVINDLQIVGLGAGVVLHCKDGFVVHDATCYQENIVFPSGNPPLVCQGETGALRLSHCRISAGFSSCKDYPECNGDQGCIASSKGKPTCDRTNKFGIPVKSGIAGCPGVQVCRGGTGFIDHCRIHDCGGGGGMVDGQGSRLFVRNCEIFKNHQSGLEARNGGKLVASENKVYDNGTHGFLIGPNTGQCLISKNKVFENRQEGVVVAYSKEKVLVDGNDIHHNMAFGFSLEDLGGLSITNNQIYHNGFWGILCKSRTSAYIDKNVISSNKCGGIFIGVNFSGKITIKSNTVRDHAGHWLEHPERNVAFGDEGTMPSSQFYLPPGETRYYSDPPCVENNEVVNNVEGIFHPTEEIERLQTRCCHCPKQLREAELRRCPECYIAVYCGQECQGNHRPKHESLCDVLKSRYSTTVKLISLTLPEHFVGERQFGVLFTGLGKGPAPKRNSRQVFVVKVQTGTLNCHPKQLLRVYDRSRTVDNNIESPEVFSMVMECGVLGKLEYFTSKKAYFWATFVEGGKKLNIFLHHLAPYQEW